MVNLITAFTIIRRRNGCRVSDWNRKEEMQENANYIAWWMLSTFWGVSARKKISVFILSPTVPKNRPKFWRKSRGSTLVKNLENFWKTIIEFDYCMMQRIMLISEAFTYPPWMILLLDLDNYPHHTQLYSTTWSGGTRWEMNCLSAETFLVRSRDGISTGSFCRYSMLPSIRTLQFNIVITLLC